MWTAKIERAKDHFKDLNEELALFFDHTPYKVATKTYTDRKLVYYIESADEVPEKIALLTGDIIQNLRSALDQLAYQLFLKNSGTESASSSIYFPIAKDQASYEAKKRRDTYGISDSAKILIDSVKPYKGGNDVIWQIHSLNIIDKHRTLITAYSLFQSVDIGANMSEAMKKSFPHLDIPNVELFVKPADILHD